MTLSVLLIVPAVSLAARANPLAAAVASPAAPTTQCNNGVDDDEDGRIDLEDAGCLMDSARDDESGEFVVNSTLSSADANPGDGVCETGVPGECTLVAAVDEANALAGQQGVQVPGGIFTVDIDINDDLVLLGAGDGITTIKSNDVAVAEEAEAWISGVDLDRGAILNFGTLTLVDSAVRFNTRFTGGGIYNCCGPYFQSEPATLTLINTIVSDNRATVFGGGIFNGGTATLIDSTVSGNSTYRQFCGGHGCGSKDYYYGGGVAHLGVSLTITNSIVSGNKAINAIDIYGTTGPVTITGTTISDNYFNGIGISALSGPTLVLTLTNSTVSGSTWGINDYDGFSSVTLIDSTVSGNEIGIQTAGELTVIGSRVIDNDTGIRVRVTGSSAGVVTVTGSTISDNSERGITNTFTARDLIVTDSTLSGNGNSNVEGGAIQITSMLTLHNVTLSGNTAAIGGALHTASEASITNSTITENFAADAPGIANFGLLFMENTIVSNCDNDGGIVVSIGHNLTLDPDCLAGTGTDQVVADLLLGPLADNGGTTLTHMPLPGSPAIDAANDAACSATDQRGEPRPVDGNTPPDGMARCDIGAVEVPEPGVFVQLVAAMGLLSVLKRYRA